MNKYCTWMKEDTTLLNNISKTPVNFHMVHYTPVTIKFDGKKCVNEIYELHIKELKDTIRALSITDISKLREAELMLLDMLSVVKNSQEVIWAHDNIKRRIR